MCVCVCVCVCVHVCGGEKVEGVSYVRKGMILSAVQPSLPLPVRLHFGLFKVNRRGICICSTWTSACGKQSLMTALSPIYLAWGT